MKPCAIISLCSLLLAAQVFAANVDATTTIDSVRQAFNTAYCAGNADGIASLLTEDALWMPPGEPSIQGKTAVRERYARQFAIGKFHFELLAGAIQAGTNWAVICGTFTRDSTIGTNAPVRHVAGRYALILQLQPNGEWQIAKDIWNLDTPAAAPTPAIDTPRPGLTLLNLKAVQQTTDYSCGPAAAMSFMRFHGRDTGDELAVAKEMHTTTTNGTTPANLAKWLETQGFTVTWGENGSLKLIRENLAKNIPTLVEWSDWGGHWVIAVGYDTRNTPSEDDDLILLADPYDRCDGQEDGLIAFNAIRFDAMWYDARLFGKLMTRIYIVAR